MKPLDPWAMFIHQLSFIIQGSFDEDGDEEDEEKSEKENKRTFKEKLQAVQVIHVLMKFSWNRCEGIWIKDTRYE